MLDLKRWIAVGISLVSWCLGHAVVFELEPNSSIASAQVISRPSGPFAEVVMANLASGGGDRDYYKVQLSSSEVLSLIVTPTQGPFDNPDTVLAVFDTAGNQLAFNDDAGNGFGSALRFQAQASAHYVVGVSGYPDDLFLGNHTAVGTYALTMSVVPVPEPGTLVACAAGALAFLRRRRR